MKTNCKLGDLAVIIRDNDFPQNVGAFVKVVGHQCEGAYPGQAAWLIQPSTPIWSFDWDESTGTWSTGKASCDMGEVNMLDVDLKPIRGLSSDDNTETTVKKEDIINV